MSQSEINVERVDDVVILTLSKPAAMNAISPAMVLSFERAFMAATRGAGAARAVMITGEGRAFCSGADLGEGRGNDVPKGVAGSVLQRAYHPMLRMLRDSPVPVVTAVNGVAAGAGMSLAMMGDIITAGRSAYFMQAFRRVGLVPDCGSSWLLPRLVGAARARELMLLGERLPAETALQWGLVNRVFDDATLREDSLAIARNLADGPTAALAMIRRLAWASEANSYEDQLNLEDELQLRASVGAEHAEGLAAFREKRAANFRSVAG